MKKILLIIALTFCIFQMVVLADVIDVGSSAVFTGSWASTRTVVNKENPANASGIITSIEVYAQIGLTDVELATFFVVAGNNLTTRDNVALANIAGGSKQTITEDSGSNPLALTVVAGDYIGIYYSGGSIYRTTSGKPGYWHILATDAIPCTNQTFTLQADYTMSLYGTGTTVEIGWPHKWNTQTISKWNTKEFTKWNDLE